MSVCAGEHVCECVCACIHISCMCGWVYVCVYECVCACLPVCVLLKIKSVTNFCKRYGHHCEWNCGTFLSPFLSILLSFYSNLTE